MHVVIGAGPAGLAVGHALARRGQEVLVLEASDRVGGSAAGIEVDGVRVDLGSLGLDPAMPRWLRSELAALVDLQERPRRERRLAGGRWVPSPPTPLDLVRSWGRGGLGQVVRRRPTALRPRSGFGALTAALAAGVPVETGRRVTRLLEQDQRVVVGLADGRIVSASHVHATIPAWQVAGMLGLHHELHPPAPRGLVLVYLVVARRPYAPFDTHELPARMLAARMSEPTAQRDDPGDPADRTVLCAEVPCWEGDDVWSAPDAGLVQRVADDLVRCGLPDPRPVASHVERIPAGHGARSPAERGAWSRAARAMERSSRVTVVGSPDPDRSHDPQVLLREGFEAARCVRDDGTFDHAAWAARGRGFGAASAGD